MPQNAWFEMSWTLKRKWFRVWEVQYYYTNLERRAKAGAEITFGYVLMVVVSALLATGGLLLNRARPLSSVPCVSHLFWGLHGLCALVVSSVIAGFFLGVYSNNCLVY